MKISLGVSIGLNLALAGGVIWVLAHPQKETVVKAAEPATAVSANPPAASAPVISDSPAPFNWSQLGVTNGYKPYIENLRAIGCPEATVADIVRGDTDRAFSFERRQLQLSDSGVGPWSRYSEAQLVASLLNGQSAVIATADPVANSAGNSSGNSSANHGTLSVAQNQAPAVYPLFLQDVNWTALGFSASQQAAIAQVRQQYLDNQANGSTDPNNNQAGATSGSSNPGTRQLTAVQLPDQQLRDLLGAQGYAAYEQAQYMNWFQPQAQANLSGQNLSLNPTAAP